MGLTEIVCAVMSALVLLLYACCLAFALRTLWSRLQTGEQDRSRLRETGEPDTRARARLFLILLAVVVLSRVLQYLIGHVMVYGLDLSNFNLDSMQYLWSRSDAPHYLGIADNWYRTAGDPRFHIVFLPLYPMCVHAVSVLLGDTFLSALVVSNIALTGACYYIYRLALMDSEPKAAFRAVKYLLLFPVAFFLGTGFSESLFLCLTAGALYYARRDRFALAAVLGALSAFTRLLGVLAFIFLVLEACERTEFYRVRREEGLGAAWRALWPRAGWSLLVPLGTFMYLLVNRLVTGDWFMFMEYQREHWHQQFGLFFINMGTIVTNLFSYEPETALFLWLPEALVMALTLVLMMRTRKTQRLSYALYALGYYLVANAPTWLLSAPRYIMAMVPLYFMLAGVTRKRWADAALTAVFLALQMAMIWGFVNGMHIY